MESFTTFFNVTTNPQVSTANTASTTTVTVVFTQSVTATTAGWSFKKDGVNLAVSSVSGSGTTWTFVVAAMAYGNVITYSYNATTGNTINASGAEVASFTDRSVTNNISPVTPTIVSIGTSDTTHITVVFSENMNVTTAGWSFKINGGALTLTSVAGSGTTWIFLVGTMASGDTLLYSYDSTTGNTVSASSSVELATATDQSVTNNISSASATLLQYQFYDFFAAGAAPPVATFVIPAPVTAHSTVIGWLSGTNNFTSPNTCTASNGDTYTLFRQEDVAGFGNSITGFYCYNASAGSTTLTVTGQFTGYGGGIMELGGCKFSGNNLLTTGSNTGSNPANATLTYGANAAIIMLAFNKNVDFSGTLSSGLTLAGHTDNSGGGVDGWGVQAYNLSASSASSPLAVGLANTDADSVMICAAFELL